jgi:hypothetical protein
MTQELLGRVHRELLDVLNSINQDKIHHDGDDFHELLNDVEKALAEHAMQEVQRLGQEIEQEPVAWLLTDKNINSLQVDSIHRLIDRLKHAHHTDLCVRINGQDEWFEADWLKHMVRVTPPQRTEQEPDDIASIIACRDMLDAQPVPPRRTWVGLNEQQRNDIEDACEMIIGKPAFDLIDAALKGNNT